MPPLSAIVSGPARGSWRVALRVWRSARRFLRKCRSLCTLYIDIYKVLRVPEPTPRACHSVFRSAARVIAFLLTALDSHCPRYPGFGPGKLRACGSAIRVLAGAAASASAAAPAASSPDGGNVRSQAPPPPPPPSRRHCRRWNPPRRAALMISAWRSCSGESPRTSAAGQRMQLPTSSSLGRIGTTMSRVLPRSIKTISWRSGFP